MSKLKETIGVGITTCNREHFFNECFDSIDLNKIDYLVIVNDGAPFDFKSTSEKVIFIQNEENLGVAKTKNKIFRTLLEKKCDHIFTMEDDCIITNNDIFEKYIQASKETGIKHFNFGPGSPWNRKQQDPSTIGDLSKRHLSTQSGDPNPKLIVEYKSGLSISLFEHVVAMFCYFDAKSLEQIGLLHEEFYNAWEHVEHTLRYIQSGYYTPFWWFADVTGSENYIKEAKNEKANTSLARNEEQFMKQVQDGLKVFHRLHGVIPSQIKPETQQRVLEVLKQIKK
jgi:GT2 family glycosyltransferase